MCLETRGDASVLRVPRIQESDSWQLKPTCMRGAPWEKPSERSRSVYQRQAVTIPSLHSIR